jgi:hypothetical protein
MGKTTEDVYLVLEHLLTVCEVAISSVELLLLQGEQSVYLHCMELVILLHFLDFSKSTSSDIFENKIVVDDEMVLWGIVFFDIIGLFDEDGKR